MYKYYSLEWCVINMWQLLGLGHPGVQNIETMEADVPVIGTHSHDHVFVSLLLSISCLLQSTVSTLSIKSTPSIPAANKDGIGQASL